MTAPASRPENPLVLSPFELLEKLAALVPPPRLNLVRYHGVLAPNAADRAQIVPGPEEEVEALAAPTSDGEPTPAQRRHRLAWAVLLARVFQFDVTECPACGGRMQIVAAVTDARSIGRYLEGVGLPSRAPPIAPARPPPQQEFDLELPSTEFRVPVNVGRRSGVRVCLPNGGYVEKEDER